MKKILFLLLIFTSFISFAQIDFQSGYYINNAGERFPVEIKYVEWKNNPAEFTYRSSGSTEARTVGIKEVTAFGVDGQVNYVRATVPVDQSNPNLKDLSNHGQFESKEETVFLKTLVEGDADLFELRRGNMQQFFYRSGEEDIQTLIYKRYIPPTSIKIAENKQYQQQLYNSLECEGITQGEITKTEYKRGQLVSLFTNYNECNNSEYKNFTVVDASRDAFNLRIRPGVNFSSLGFSTSVVKRDLEFGNKTGLRLGLEGEYVLPFFRNKWSFIVEPTYRSYEGETTFPEPAPLEDGTVSVKYQSIELPFGVRHYFFLNNDHQIFINATYTVDFVVGDSYYDFETAADYPDNQFDSNSGTNFSFGLGYNFKRYQVEARYNTEREVSIGNSRYKSFSVIFGYNFL